MGLHQGDYRTAGNFQGIQFSRKVHIQRFCDLIFADGRSRVAPPTLSISRLGSASYSTRTAAQISLEKVVKNQQAIVFVLSGNREMARESHMIEARDICVEEAQQQ